MALSPAKCACTGGIGAALTALCCFTPLLVIALGGVGSGWLAAYLDWVLLPLFLMFVLLLVLGLWRLRGRGRIRPGAQDPGETS